MSSEKLNRSICCGGSQPTSEPSESPPPRVSTFRLFLESAPHRNTKSLPTSVANDVNDNVIDAAFGGSISHLQFVLSE